MAIIPAMFDEQNGMLPGFAQSSSEDATRGAGADDDVIELLLQVSVVPVPSSAFAAYTNE